jgi:hypothetical protein
VNFAPPPYKTETSNLALAPKINAALAHVATALGVSKSAYVESLLRVKFGIEDGVAGNFSREGLIKHLQREGMTIPSELKDFQFQTSKKLTKRKPGRIPRSFGNEISAKGNAVTAINGDALGPGAKKIYKS